MERQPAPPSFLSSSRKQAREQTSQEPAEHVGKSSPAVAPVPIAAPLQSQTPATQSATPHPDDPAIGAQIRELRASEQETLLFESMEQNLESEAELPGSQGLELSDQELLRKREGNEALLALEREAHNQEIERIRRSRIEVPELGLRMREGNSCLQVSHLHKRYGRKVAVEDISISLRQGEVVGLLGPNGAGKTTCFYMIAGFVQPTQGQVLLDEREISRWPMFKRAREGISYLPQEASIFRSLTVEQNLLAILEYRKDLGRKARMEMADFLMERLGVLRLRKQRASTLSGGERRRVEVARALTLEPRFLLLDEPFAGIDPIAVSEIKGIIRALAQSNIGILITDHNVRDTLDITDRSYIVNLGEILVSGSRAELIASKVAREIYLGTEFN